VHVPEGIVRDQRTGNGPGDEAKHQGGEKAANVHAPLLFVQLGACLFSSVTAYGRCGITYAG
jgi:hypothetical protein